MSRYVSKEVINRLNNRTSKEKAIIDTKTNKHWYKEDMPKIAEELNRLENRGNKYKEKCITKEERRKYWEQSVFTAYAFYDCLEKAINKACDKLNADKVESLIWEIYNEYEKEVPLD